MNWNAHTVTYRRQEYLARIEAEDGEDIISVEEEVDSEISRVQYLAINEHNLRKILAIPKLIDALEEIAKGRGPFKRDPLEFATACLDHAVETAKAALLEIGVEPETVNGSVH
jgi:hypothetical protein